MQRRRIATTHVGANASDEDPPTRGCSHLLEIVVNRLDLIRISRPMRATRCPPAECGSSRKKGAPVGRMRLFPSTLLRSVNVRPTAPLLRGDVDHDFLGPADTARTTVVGVAAVGDRPANLGVSRNGDWLRIARPVRVI